MKCIVYNKLTFTNKEIDYTLDLHYFGARYYSSTLPRFISPDPVNGTPTKPLSWNRYLYCRNDPINKYDPDGRLLKEIAEGVGNVLKKTRFVATGIVLSAGASIFIATSLKDKVDTAENYGEKKKAEILEARANQGSPNRDEYIMKIKEEHGIIPPRSDSTDEPVNQDSQANTDAQTDTETTETSNSSGVDGVVSESEQPLPEYEKKWRNGEIGPGEYNRMKAEGKAEDGY